MSTDAKETGYQLAQPVVVQGHAYADVSKGEGTFPLIPGQKRGHKCCGGCCDVRRAVIIVDAVNIMVLAFGLASMLAIKKTAATMEFTDDKTSDAMDAIANLPLGTLIAACVVPMVTHSIGIVGALMYNKWMVGFAGVAYCVMMIIDALAFNIVGLICKGFSAYPHYFLVKEIHQGTMTKENYPNEVMSCCCV